MELFRTFLPRMRGSKYAQRAQRVEEMRKRGKDVENRITWSKDMSFYAKNPSNFIPSSRGALKFSGAKALRYTLMSSIEIAVGPKFSFTWCSK